MGSKLDCSVPKLIPRIWSSRDRKGGRHRLVARPTVDLSEDAGPSASKWFPGRDGDLGWDWAIRVACSRMALTASSGSVVGILER